MQLKDKDISHKTWWAYSIFIYSFVVELFILYFIKINNRIVVWVFGLTRIQFEGITLAVDWVMAIFHTTDRKPKIESVIKQ